MVIKLIDMTEISIIVPVYKVENYLSQCISSILEQAFSDFELLLIDDDTLLVDDELLKGLDMIGLKEICGFVFSIKKMQE